ncbi:MAG: hypothetical protein JKY27_05255 [Magnetovibrio sp.]|nr:hypothetical protein [Magnetovibrio sp.]
MVKIGIDEDVLKEIKKLNIVMRKGKLGKIQDATKVFRKTNGPMKKLSKYDCGQCIVCAASTATPTPDIEIAVVTGVVML